MSGNSTPERPFRNGQTLTYYYTFRNSRTGAVIAITGKTITWQMKRRGEAYSNGSGSVSDGPNGIAVATITIDLTDMTEETEAINIQLYANGMEVPGQPQTEYVAPNTSDLAALSQRLIDY